jgi:hypothetical protein
MSRKRPRKWKEEPAEREPLDRGIEEKEQEKEDYDAFGFMKNKKQTAAVAGVFFLFGFMVSWLASPSMTGMVVEEGTSVDLDQIGQSAVEFLNEYFIEEGEVTLVSVEEDGELIEVTTSYQGNEIPVYMTRDGRFIILGGVGAIDMAEYEELIEAQQAQESQQGGGEIPKSDRPVAELYVFSYCPAGSAALDSFAEAADFLKNYADFKVKFFSHMHGEHERQQNMIQACMQRVAPDKYWEYAKRFLEEVYQECTSSRSTECDKEKSIALMEAVGINPDEVMDCVEQNGEAYYQEDNIDSSEFGLSSSPSLVVNNFSFGPSYDRSPDGIKNMICSAFNTPPEECSQDVGVSGSASSGAC